MERVDANLLRVWWTVSAMLVLLMQLGFINLEMGCVRKASRTGIAVKNFVMLLVSSITFVMIGVHLMFGPTAAGFVGMGAAVLELDSYGWLFFQTGFASVAATILSGALAGRTTLFSNVVMAFLMTVVIYPVFGHWMWNAEGWLSTKGAIDFAGSGVVHFIGGFTALLAAGIVGPRRGFIRDGKVQDLGPRNLPFATVAVIFLWVGWIGFNGGSVLPGPDPEPFEFARIGRAVLTTSCAASGGGLAAMVIAGLFHWRPGRGRGLSLPRAFRQKLLFDPWATLGGTMGGMVAVTANCDWLYADYGERYFLWAAVLIGAVGGAAALATGFVVRTVLRVDDPVEAVGVHAGAGAAGILLASLSGDGSLRVQCLVLIAAATWVLIVAWPSLLALRRLGLLRASPAEEELGLTFEPYETSVFTAEITSESRGRR